VPYAALDQDRSAASRTLLAKLDGSGVFDRVADLRRASDMADYNWCGRYWRNILLRLPRAASATTAGYAMAFVVK
jgi:hypothetical protein